MRYSAAKAGYCAPYPEQAKVRCSNLNNKKWGHVAALPTDKDVLCTKYGIVSNTLAVRNLKGPAQRHFKRSQGPGHGKNAAARCLVVKHTACRDGRCAVRKHVTCHEVCQALGWNPNRKSHRKKC